MKKKIIALLYLYSLNIFAQNQNSIWIFGDSAGINFNTGIFPISTTIDSRGSCVSICDSVGDLLFFSYTRAGLFGNTTLVKNKNHQLMQNGDSIVGQAWYNELTIIPNLGIINSYFLFSAGETNSGDQGLYYSVIDMNINGGLGDVSLKNIELNHFRNADCLTAIKHGNGRDWWVLSKYSDPSPTNFNRFYVYLVGPDSIYAPIIQDFNNMTDADFQHIVFNSDGSKMMQIQAGGFMCEYDFDRCNGLLSNPIIIYPEQFNNYNRIFFAGAYSPDGTRFYITTRRFGGIDSTYLLQYDLTASDIPASVDTLYGNYPPVEFGQVRLAPDNKIYVTSFYYWGFPGYPYPDSVFNMYNENLGVINYPDSSGASCDFQPFSFYLGGKRTYYGLPNNPDYSLGPVVGSSCDSLNTVVNEVLLKTNARLFVFYHNNWQKVFINAQHLKGRNYQLNIFDPMGKLIFHEQGTLNSEYYTRDVNCSAMAGGMYIVHFSTDKEVISKKFMKE